VTKWLKLSFLALCFLFFANHASAQGALYHNIAWRYTPAGAFPAGGATVTICTSNATGAPCTPKITLYQDSALTIPVANPLAQCTSSPQVGCLDNIGNFSFYMSQGPFTYTISGAGLNPYGPIPDVSIATGGTPPLGNNGDLQKKNGAALAASGLNDNGTVLSTAETLSDTNGININASPLLETYTNDPTGTVSGKLVRFTPSATIATALTNTVKIIGPCFAGCGASGTAQVAAFGQAPCVFDNATTAGDLVGISGSVAGDCTDIGTTYPTNGNPVIGVVRSTNGGGGTYSVDLLAQDSSAAASTASGTVNNASQFSLTYYCAPGLSNVLCGGGTTAPTLNGNWGLTYVVTANAAVSPVITLPGIPINAQVGTTYTYLYSDRIKLVTFNNSSPVAVTLPQASSVGFTSNFANANCNLGTGLVTITPTTSTINGAASATIPQNWCGFLYSDNTNYRLATFSNSGTIASGTSVLGTSLIASGACASVVTTSAPGTLTTDVITPAFNGDPTAVTGYGASATGAVLTIYPYPTANNVNFKVCNSTGSSITPGALTLNWRVSR